MNLITSIILNDTEVEVEVTYTPHGPILGQKGPHGEPMEPDEDAYIEIEDVTANGETVMAEISMEQMDDLERVCEKDCEGHASDAAISRYEASLEDNW